MKKFLLAIAAIVLSLSVLSGCSKLQTDPPAATEPSASLTEPTKSHSAEPDHAEPAPVETKSDTENEGDASSDSVAEIYAQQVERYYTAISDQWDESTYFDHEMSPMAAYYYEENALDNVGFAFIDLDGDNIQELIIGAIRNSEQHPLVFELWTLNNGEPVMLAQSGSRNRYYLQYAEEDNAWSIAYEAENGAANHAVYYLQLSAGKFEVIQGVLFDAVASESAPWFMTYDLDWDISNDMPIDEDAANAVMEAGRNIYTAMEYLPYSLYK